MSAFSIEEVLLDSTGYPMIVDNKYLCRIIDDKGSIQIVQVEEDVVRAMFKTSQESNHPNAEDEDDDIITVEKNSDNNSQREDNEPEQNGKKEWTEAQTKMLLDLYYEYLPNVGPMKKFKSKKDLWARVRMEINKNFNSKYTLQNVENRYKTILKRKKNSVANNLTSGAKRQKVEYEEELRKIASVDDSVEPEVLKGQKDCILKNKNKDEEEELVSPKSKKDTIISYLKKVNEEKKVQRQELFKEKEENKERRHKEKMDLLKELFKPK